jgi:hypothetical protein
METQEPPEVEEHWAVQAIPAMQAVQVTMAATATLETSLKFFLLRFLVAQGEMLVWQAL